MVPGNVILRPSNITKTLVCIDGIFHADMTGRLFNPYIRGPIKFFGMIGMVRELENMMDEFSFPESTFRYQTFREENYGPRQKNVREVRRFMSDDILQQKFGEQATFVVQVQFRQNATWQGTIQWLEEKESRKFRSLLEMIKLMDEALTQEQETDETVNWDLVSEKAI